MKKITYKGFTFGIDSHNRIERLISDENSWLNSVIKHSENGLIKEFNGKEIITDFKFIKTDDFNYVSSFDDIFELSHFRIKITNIYGEGKEFRIRFTHLLSDISKIYSDISFVTLEEAIKFANIIINYEIVKILTKIEVLFKK